MQKAPAYVQALHQEWLWYLDSEVWRRYQPYTLYIGGGTPSSILDALLGLLKDIARTFPLESFLERTIEINPGTVGPSQLRQLRQSGFNRLSIGIQSFHNDELRLLGRIHDSEEAIRCVREAREAGFNNISLDLMSALPSSTLARWEENIRQAIDLNPEHISMYNLTIEEGTPFWQRLQNGTLILPEEELQIDMYQNAIDLLTTAGYEHYEISNFARPDYRSRHNQIYWRNEEYLGLGAGAYSYLNGFRYGNCADLDRYITSAEDSISSLDSKNDFWASNPLTVEHRECLRRTRQIGETIMMNLRLIEGIDLLEFHQRFGQKLEDIFPRELEKLLSLELIEMQNQRLRLSPKGLLLANEVCQEFIELE